MTQIPVAPAFDQPELLDYSDYPSVRQNILDKTLSAVQESFPVSNDRYTLGVTDLRYRGKPEYTLKEQKAAIQGGRTLSRQMVGKWQLTDNATGQVVGTSNARSLMNVPYMTDRGTYIRNGSEWVLAKQFRLQSGVYTRKTDDGNVEAQFNAKPRTGPSFRIFMEPSTGNFYMKYANRKIPLYPVLQAMGYPMDKLKEAWGPELYAKNEKLSRSPHAVNWLRQFTAAEKEREDRRLAREDLKGEDQKTAAEEGDYADMRPYLLGAFNRIQLNPEVTQTTLGKPYDTVTPDAIVEASKKILGVHQGVADIDDRDSLEFQTIHDSSDFLSEKVRHDQNQLMRQVLWKLTNRNGDISKIPPSVLDKHVQYMFNNSGLGQSIEGINPMDMYDQNQRVVRLGEGAMSSVDIVPKEARNVQPSYAGFVDSVRAPESMRIGVDMKLAHNVRRGNDGQLYTQFLDPKTMQPAWLSAKQAARSVLAFPESLKSEDRFVPAMDRAKGMYYVDRAEVDYIIPSGASMYSDGSNMVPFFSGVKAMRLLMGAKFGSQALPLVNREAPLVQSRVPDGEGSMEERMGVHMGAVKAKAPGTVKAVYADHIDMAYDDGTEGKINLYNNFPFSRKTAIRNSATVKAGQRVGAGDLLATSNYTDGTGKASLGTNLRVAYLNYDGKVFEDAVVISQSAAKKMTSEHMYTTRVDDEKEVTIDKEAYRALYPGRFDKKQLGMISPSGVVKSGTVLNYGDPVYLSVREREPSASTMGRSVRQDESTTWKHQFPGLVTDAVQTKKGWAVYTRANLPMQEGDKISNRFGGKGVVSAIVSDTEMPQDSKGRVFDILMSPLGIASRTNPAQMAEVSLGKVAEKTGKAYVVDGFTDDDIREYTDNELRKHGLRDREDITNPKSRKTIPGVFSGMTYVYKLQHTSEGKGKSRATAHYTADDQPARGGKTGSKHLGDMEIQALLSHGATKVLKDMKLVKGQKNDDFWRALKLGKTPTAPGSPLVYKKFRELLRASGVELRESKTEDYIFAMTDTKAKDLTGDRRLQNASTYGTKSQSPLPGGLFDPEMTGSKGDGGRWSYIQLPAPMPNPIMAEPMRAILGMTRKQFESIASGQEQVEGKTGGDAIQGMLEGINIRNEKDKALDDIKHGAKSKRDQAIKRFNYLDGFEKNGVHPRDFMMTRVPVLPPRFRPIIKQNDMTMVADPNYLYKALMESIEDYNDSQDLPDEVKAEASKNVYDSYQALVGVASPQQEKLVQKRVGGILQQVFGKNSPKTGMVQRRVIGTNIDVSGLGVVTPNPSLNLDEVGLPEKLAWDLYEPFVIREMVRNGSPATYAAESVAKRAPAAYKALQTVVQSRPVIVNRAPTLHKYNMMAFKPVLVKGSTLQVSPPIVKSFAMDFDGNCIDFATEIYLTLSKSLVDSEQVIESTCKESIMRASKSTTILTDGSVRAIMQIGEFPRMGTPVKDKNGADVFAVPAGVSVLSYDITTGNVGYSPVEFLTVEQDVPVAEVKTRRKSVIVSDNESLAVFDVDTGNLRKVAPEGSEGSWVPVVRRSADFGDVGDFDIGWLYGVLTADGWVTKNTLGYSKCDKSLRDRVVSIIRERITENFKVHTYEYNKDDHKSRYGDGAKIHINDAVVVQGLYKFCAEAVPADKGKRAALRKHLPVELLTNGSEDCLWGLLSGLLDGDCGLSVKPRGNGKGMVYTIVLHTSSEQLQRDICVLGMKLGIRTGVTESHRAHTENTAYSITLSAVDLAHRIEKVKSWSSRNQADFKRLQETPPGEMDKLDIIPLTDDERDILRPLVYKTHMSAYSAVSKRNAMARKTLLDIWYILENTEGLEALARRVYHRDMTWEQVISVESLGSREVFDLGVAHTKVFVVNSGLVIYDTAAFSVPVSKDAVDEAYEKMLPSKHLLSARSGKPTYAPSNEYLQGLYLATREPSSKKPVTFATRKEAMAAYQRGEIAVDDPIIIKEAS